MRLTDLLSADRVAIRHVENGGTPSGRAFDKRDAISLLSHLLADGAHIAEREVEKVLLEREGLQSTGIGEGVAIPHGALSQLENQWAALLIVPEGVEFQAIDGTKVTILFAVIGPKRATGEHLKTLARVSRLLRNKEFRDQLIASPSASSVYELIATEETDRR